MDKELPKAIFSENRKYRYLLSRQWDNTKPYVAFIGLNPSTADETKDDPTIRRCIQFAKDWQYGGLLMGNIFAYRSADPRVLKKKEEVVDLTNLQWLQFIYNTAHITVAAWGNHGKLYSRALQVKSVLPDCKVLGMTKSNYPKHPLYLKKDLKPIDWYYPSFSALSAK